MSRGFLMLLALCAVASAATLEFGTVNLSNNWVKVKLRQNFDDPIPMVSVPDYAQQPGVVTVGEVTPDYFMVHFSSWDGSPVTPIKANFLVAERGHFTYGDIEFEAGSSQVSGNMNRNNIKPEKRPFIEKFATKPMIFSVATENGQPSATRHANVNKGKFKVALQEYEASKRGHPEETVYYIAITPGSGYFPSVDGDLFFTCGKTVANKAPTATTIYFEPVMGGYFFAHAQTVNGADPITLFKSSFTANMVNVFVIEDQTKDEEMNHISESIGFLVVEDHSTNLGSTPEPEEPGKFSTKEPDNNGPGPGPVVDHWEKLPNAPIKLSETGAAIIGTKIYSVGHGSLKTLVFDTADHSWEVLPAERPLGGDHIALQAYNNKLFGFAGLRGAENMLQIYNIKSEKWSVQTLPFKSDGAMTSVRIDNLIYILGGRINFVPKPWAWSYDAETGEFKRLADMPLGVHHTAAGVHGDNPNLIYVFGGRAQGFMTEQIQVYNIQKNSWTANAGRPIPGRGRSGFGTAPYYNGEFYLMGGEAFQPCETFDRLDIYNPATNTWRSGEPMQHARHGLWPVFVEDKMYVILGGQAACTFGDSYYSEVYYP
eukprot:m.93512 g.93512  ORF g.93512 m.93512 type:complete len:598 (+) comp8690_c1_seq1:94-1887(+)